MRGLFIGRFQPLHNGHVSIIENALMETDEVIAGIGSAENSYTPRDPFTAGERMEMLIAAGRELGWGQRVIPVPIRDVNRYSIWVSHVISLCPDFELVYTNNPLTRRLFEDEGFEVRSTPLVDRAVLSGEKVRESMANGSEWKGLVPTSVAALIKELEGEARVGELFLRGDK